MTWWTTVPGLTPIAVYDANNVSSTQILDRIGTNHITPTSAVSTWDFEYVGVPGNSNPMPLTTPITIPTTGVTAGFWSPRRRNVLLSQAYGDTSKYKYTLHQADDAGIVNHWVTSNVTYGSFGAYGVVGQRYFVAYVTRGTDVICYVDGNLLGSIVSISNMIPSVGVVGYGTNGNEYNLDADERLHALGFWSGVVTQADIQALEAACRAALVGPQQSFRGVSLPVGVLANPVQEITVHGVIRSQAMPRNVSEIDIHFGGTGQVIGTVKYTPNSPVHRRVRLVDELTNICVKEGWSDPTTGAYLFDRVALLRRYTVISYDYTGVYRAVIADGIYAEPMP